MAVIIDLRRYRRFFADGIVAQIDDEIIEVIDISVAGIRLARPPTWVERRNVEFRLIPQDDKGLNYHRAIPVCGHIVGDGPDHLRIAFSAVTPALANVIGRYDRSPSASGVMPSQALTRRSSPA